MSRIIANTGKCWRRLFLATNPVCASPRVEILSGLPSIGVGTGFGLGEGDGVGKGLGVGKADGLGVEVGFGPSNNSAVVLMKGRPTPPAIRILPSSNWVAV